MEVVSIPLTTKVSTSTLDDQIHTADRVLLNKKNSIVYQNSLSNMKSIRGSANTYPLTNGAEVAITDAGIRIEDEVWPYDNDYILKTNKSFLNKNRGTWLSGTVYKTENVFVINAYRKSKSSIDVYIDNLDGSNVLKRSYSYSGIFFDISFSSTYNYFNDDYITPVMIMSYAYNENSSYVSVAKFFRLNTNDLPEDETGGWTGLTNRTTSSSYGPLGAVKYSTVLQADTDLFYLVYGHYDSDQRRCCSYIKTGSDFTTDVVHYDGFGCISPEGTITGEPIPVLTSKSATASYTFDNMVSDFGMTILANGQLKWNLLRNPSASSGVGKSNHYGGQFRYAYTNETGSSSFSPPNVRWGGIGTWVNYWIAKAYSIMYAVKPVYSSNKITFTIMKKSDYTPSSNTAWNMFYYPDGDPQADCYWQSPRYGMSYMGRQHISPEQIGEIIPPSNTSVYDNPAGDYWFSNVQSDKGNYWDFGPGWSKFMIFVAGPAWVLYEGPSVGHLSSPAYLTGRYLIGACANYAHRAVHLYTYGLSYPEYDSSISNERALTDVIIDKVLSSNNVDDTYFFTGENDPTSSMTTAQGTSVLTEDERDPAVFYQKWTNGWRFINCTDSEKSWPYLGAVTAYYTYIEGTGVRIPSNIYRWCDGSYGCVTEPYITYAGSDSVPAHNFGTEVYDSISLVSNPVIKCMIGGDISKVDGFINLIPSIVEVVPKAATENNTWSVQYYDSLPISHSFAGTLISSGSDGRNDNWTNITIDDSNYLLADGYLYDAYNWDSSVDTDLLYFDKIADNRIRINIIDGKNLVASSAENQEFVRSFRPYNMYGLFSTSNWTGTKNCSNTTSGAANDTWYFGAAVNAMMLDGFDTSYLLPAVTVPIYVDSDDLGTFNSKIVSNRSPVIQPIMNKTFEDDDTIDVFYTHALSSTDVTYKSTNVFRSYGANEYKSYGNPTYEPDKANTSWWVDSSVIIFPMGLATEATEVNYVTPTIKLLSDYYARLYTRNGNTFLSFNESQLLNNASFVFTIYANNYYYDGQSIYFAGSDTNVYDSAQFVCYALGMEFLGNSGTEAYFYSPYEKRIFIFTGSNTLQAEDSLAKFGNVIDHAFSSHEQILYLLNDQKQLLIRTPLDEAILDLPYSGKLVTTDSGVAIIYDNNAGFDIPNPHDGNYTFPFTYETGFIGDSGSLLNIAYVDVMLYNDDEVKSDKLTLGFNVIDEITPIRNSKDFDIRGVEWKGNNARVRLVPKNTQGNAFQVSIDAADDIKVTSIQVAFDQVSSQPNTKNRR